MERAATEVEETGARPNAFFPLVTLLLVLVVVGCLNTSLVEPYTQPRTAGDDGAVYLFYDAAERTGSTERTFLLRRTTDGRHFEKAQRVEGTLLSAAVLSDEHLVGLFPEFFSVYARARGLERESSAAASPDALGFEARHLARLDGKLYAFGTQPKDGSLRVARIDGIPGEPDWRLVPLEARIERAAEPPGAEVADRAEDAPQTIPAPVAWTSADAGDGTLSLFFRVARPRARTGEVPKGEVRLVRFDGTAFVGSSFTSLEEDYPAIAATALPAEEAPVGTEVHLFAAKRDDPAPTPGEGLIRDLVFSGARCHAAPPVAYKKGGFFEDRPTSALAAILEKGRVLLFAQVGGTIRVAVKESGRWGEWSYVARMPTEAMALVYFYLGALFLLGVVMTVAALVALKDRLTRHANLGMDEATADRLISEALGKEAPRSPERPKTRSALEEEDAAENDAPIHDRLVAFLIDLGIVVGILLAVHAVFPLDITPKPGEDPTLQLAMRAWCIVAFLAYTTLCEVIFGRTPGKRLFGLEIKTTDGKDPGLLALLYRNLLRIEVIFFVTAVHIPTMPEPLRFIGPIIGMAVTLATPRAQRPGDLVAGTVVQRVRDVRPARTAAPAEDEEESQA
ncbi:MAG TPA: RDD family protein [Planctomycetota bacterium]|nr:RDD family protein [Planctomycetota bacterium]